MAQGQRIGRYELRSELGAGGFATVYQALDPNLERVVALKVLHPHLARDPQVRERFVREGRALARVRHPNIVQVFDSGEADGTAYMAMEFVRGTALADILAERGPMSLDDVATIVEQASAALAAVHAQNLVHRDIKPANILLEEGSGRAVLLDLGVARDLANATMTGGFIVGTPGYMGPEQLDGKSPITPQTDVYQLAATVYTLLTGRLPFEGDTAQVLSAIITQPPPDLAQMRPDLPSSIARVVTQGMSKNPAQRPQGTRDFALQFRQALNSPVQQGGAPPIPIGGTMVFSPGQGAPPSNPYVSPGSQPGMGPPYNQPLQPGTGGGYRPPSQPGYPPPGSSPGFAQPVAQGGPSWGGIPVQGGGPGGPTPPPIGYQQQPWQGPGQAAPAKKRGKGWIWAIGAVVVVLVSLGIIGALTGDNKDDNVTVPTVAPTRQGGGITGGGTQTAASLTGQQIYDMLLSTAPQQSELPSGFSSATQSKGTPTDTSKKFNVIGDVDISLKGPDDSDAFFYSVYPSDADAKANWDNGTTSSTLGKPQGVSFPSVCYETASTTTSTPSGFSFCRVLVGNVVILSASQINGAGKSQGNLQAAQAMAKSAVDHLLKVRAGR